jgi:hypothetical protein
MSTVLEPIDESATDATTDVHLCHGDFFNEFPRTLYSTDELPSTCPCE